MPSAAEKRKFLELQLSYKERKIEEIENERKLICKICWSQKGIERYYTIHSI